MADLLAAWVLLDLLSALDSLTNLTLLGGAAAWLLHAERAAAAPPAEDATANHALMT